MKPLHISLRQLQVFVAIAHTGGVSAAADQIGMTQSAASMALADLEARLQAQLFDRLGKRLRLSRFGEQQLIKAEQIVAQALAFEHSHDTEVAGAFTLASSMTIGSYMLPDIINDFVRRYPAIELKMPLTNTADVIEAVLRFDADLGLIEGFCHQNSLASITWQHDELMVFAAADSPWATLAGQADQLIQAPWILREAGSGTRSVLERALALSEQQALNIYLELSSHEAIIQMVKAGMGIGCLSKQVLSSYLAEGKLVDLTWSTLDLQRSLSLIWRPDRYLATTARAFIDTLGLTQAFEHKMQNYQR